jgi:molecular chaperone GrpE
MTDENINTNDELQEEVKENATEDCKNCGEYKMGWQRAQADYQNLVRETAKQKGEWMQMIKGNILEDFIPVYDNFKKAFAHEATDPKQFENWKKGIEYIMKQFGDIIKQNGVEEIKTVGEMFDARVHEIVAEEESETAKEHEIIREVESGYKSAEKVLKVAKVIVAK